MERGLSHTQEPSAPYNYPLFVYGDLPCNMHAHMVYRSVTLTSPGQPGLSFARACMTSQCITSWGLNSNGITSLCPNSWHTPSTRRDLPERQVCPLVYIYMLRAYLQPALYKEGLSRTVVREVLLRATTQRHQTFPYYGRHARSRSKRGDVREEAPAEECAAKKKLKTTVRHLGFTEKLYGFRARSHATNTKEEPQPLFANSSRER